MLRSILIIVLAGLLPSSLLSQDGSSGPNESKSISDSAIEQTPYTNEVGLGVHSLWFSKYPSANRWLLQGTYKKRLKHFSLRAGIGGGATYFSSSNPGRWEKGLSDQWFLILNAGIEKAVWNVLDIYEMSFAVDLAYLSKKRIPGNPYYYDHLYGGALTWIHQFYLSWRSSFSIEAGLGYGRWKMVNTAVEKIVRNERSFFLPRNLVISYHYHFK